MTEKRGLRLSFGPFLLLMFILAGCRSVAYEATFDEIGAWPNQVRPDVTGQIRDGAYVMDVRLADQPTTFWAPAGENIADGIFSVEATQLAGPLNSGYGLVFRLDDETDNFYAFEISGDGYAWIGWCEAGCTGVNSATLLREWWFASAAINRGLNRTNKLQVNADGPNLIFYINGFEIGRVSDDRLASGDIALLVETLTLGELTVAFDNVRVTDSGS